MSSPNPTSTSGSNAVSEVRRSRKFTANDFRFGKILGDGSFSTVYLAKEVSSDKEYAIKVLQKQQMVREHKTEYVMREKEVLQRLGQKGHPFFVILHATFQDPDRLFFVLSYEPNGELLQYIRRLSAFDMESTKFYTSEIVLALEHLHGLNIVHRDLKPENILLSKDMHIRVTDFGSARILTSSNDSTAPAHSPNTDNNITNIPNTSTSVLFEEEDSSTREPSHRGHRTADRRGSFVGTAQYVSPEVLQNKPITKSCDLWALGCILYQLISGEHPFRAANEYHIFQKIIKLDYEYPEGFDKDGREVVEKLLKLESEERIGSDKTGGYKALKGLPFFNGIDWENLPTQQAPKLVPYLPAMDQHNNEPIWSTIETGLSGLQLTRLEGLSLTDQPVAEEVEEVATSFPELLLSEQEKKRLLQKQALENDYHKFVENNLILHQGLLDKRKGLFARRRMFLMTEGPHLYYVDPVNKVLKGQIPWSRAVRPEHKNFKVFFVHTPKRTYYLEDPEAYALTWCKKIEELWKYYYGPRNPKHKHTRSNAK